MLAESQGSSQNVQIRNDQGKIGHAEAHKSLLLIKARNWAARAVCSAIRAVTGRQFLRVRYRYQTRGGFIFS
jgi:hypothetical protein